MVQLDPLGSALNRSWRSYHHREGQGHDVDGDQRAEAGQDGQEQVVPGFGPVPGALCDGAGLASQRGPGRARRQRAGPAAQARPAVNMATWLGVKLGRHRGRCGRRLAHGESKTITWKRSEDGQS